MNNEALTGLTKNEICTLLKLAHKDAPEEVRISRNSAYEWEITVAIEGATYAITTVRGGRKTYRSLEGAIDFARTICLRGKSGTSGPLSVLYDGNLTLKEK